jgi:hypothetical protein
VEAAVTGPLRKALGEVEVASDHSSPIPGFDAVVPVEGATPHAAAEVPALDEEKKKILVKKLEEAKKRAGGEPVGDVLVPVVAETPTFAGLLLKATTRELTRQDERMKRGRQKKKRHRRDRGRSRRRRRDESSTSDYSSSSESSSSGVFGDARGVARPLSKKAAKAPGKLTQRALKKMQELLLNRRMDGTEDSLVRPVAGVFASTIMLPQLGPAVPARSVREIKFVAYLIDLLLEGKMLEGLDVLCQRLKALETAHAHDGEG